MTVPTPHTDQNGASGTRIVPPHPLVSVCVLNYNYERFLAGALDSALAQDYDRVEVIVVDDGSTDGSKDVISAYGDRVRAVFKANGGQGSAVNAGVAAAAGDVVMILDADDLLLPGAVRRVVDAFTDDPSLAKVQFRMEIADEAGQSTGLLLPPRAGVLPSGDLRRHVIRYRNYAWQPTTANAHPTWVLRELLPIPEDGYRGNADAYLAELAPLLGPIRSLDEPGARYRMHDANDFAQRGVSVEWLHMKLALVCRGHRHLQELAGRLGLDGVADDPGAPLDPAFLTFRLASLKLDPSHHPFPGDRALPLAARGMRAVVRHPHLLTRDRLKRLGWFVAAALAPRPVAALLFRIYVPDSPTRPRWTRAVNRARRRG